MLPEAVHIPYQVPPSIFKVSNREFLLCPIPLCICFKSLASSIRLRWLGQTHLGNPPILRSTDLGLNYICNPSQPYLDSCLNNLGGVSVHQRAGISGGHLRILSTTVINCSHCYSAHRTHRDVPAEMGCLECSSPRDIEFPVPASTTALLSPHHHFSAKIFTHLHPDFFRSCQAIST